jgi:hypothetical protein
MGIAGGPWCVETRVNPGKPTDCRRPWSLSEIIKTNFVLCLRGLKGSQSMATREPVRRRLRNEDTLNSTNLRTLICLSVRISH